MTATTEEWVSKAEGDFGSAHLEMQPATDANYDAVCYHAQQCVEKLMKARLAEAGVAFPKSHDLVELLDLVRPLVPDLGPWEHALDRLSEYAVDSRYPGWTANREQARQALSDCRSVRDIVRRSLGLPV
jgi:HEPN domain-containing protein